MRKSSLAGFTLVEIMTAVAIVGCVMALSVPPFLRSLQHANEAVAKKTLTTIHTAMTTYRAVHPGYPSRLGNLRAVENGGLSYLDDVVASGQKSGYAFSIEKSDENTYLVRATPQNPGVTGSQIFAITELGVVENNSKTAATTTSSATDHFPDDFPWKK